MNEIKFISKSKSPYLEFYFDTNYSFSEMTDEVNEYIKDYRNNNDNNFTAKHFMELDGDWTKVPVIRHKLRLIKGNLF